MSSAFQARYDTGTTPPVPATAVAPPGCLIRLVRMLRMHDCSLAAASGPPARRGPGYGGLQPPAPGGLPLLLLPPRARSRRISNPLSRHYAQRRSRGFHIRDIQRRFRGCFPPHPPVRRKTGSFRDGLGLSGGTGHEGPLRNQAGEMAGALYGGYGNDIRSPAPCGGVSVRWIFNRLKFQEKLKSSVIPKTLSTSPW